MILEGRDAEKLEAQMKSLELQISKKCKLELIVQKVWSLTNLKLNISPETEDRKLGPAGHSQAGLEKRAGAKCRKLWKKVAKVAL